MGADLGRRLNRRLQTCMLFLAVALSCCLIHTTAEDTPPGHLQPIGSHRPPEGTIDSVDGFLHPKDFYEKYVKASRPLLFKGAGKLLPAFQKWNDAYINETYGNLAAFVESKKKEDRDAESYDMTFSSFLKMYNQSSVYMVQDVHRAMDGDVGLPKPLVCGGFQNILQTAVIWFSSGGTRSVLHSDDVDNINCLIDGEKDLVMFDRKYKSDIEADGFNFDRGFSSLDIDAVDMLKFPKIQHLPWWNAKMVKGDCLFIPYKWFHQVNSRGRNLAVNLWFFHMFHFNQTDCDEFADETKADFISLSNYEMLGVNSIEAMRMDLFLPFEGLKQIEAKDVKRVYGSTLSSDEEVAQFIAILDSNKDSVIDWNEAYLGNPEDIIERFPKVLPEYGEEGASPEGGENAAPEKAASDDSKEPADSKEKDSSKSEDSEDQEQKNTAAEVKSDDKAKTPERAESSETKKPKESESKKDKPKKPKEKKKKSKKDKKSGDKDKKKKKKTKEEDKQKSKGKKKGNGDKKKKKQKKTSDDEL